MNERNARVAAALAAGVRLRREPLLVVASGAARVNTDVLEATLGADSIRKADAALVRRVTGQVIGGLVWTAAGTADSVLPLTYSQLLALTAGQGARVR